MALDKFRIQRAGELGIATAIRAGDETMGEITRKTINRAAPAIADELIKSILAEFGSTSVESLEIAAHIRSELGSL
jgi:hypothetical protein